MVGIPTFTRWTFVLFALGFVAAILGWNMPLTWYIHTNGSFYADVFFSFYTQLAEWFIIVLAAITTLLARKQLFYLYVVAASIQGLLVWGLKQWFNAPRPATLSYDTIRTIPGVSLQYWKSFPSGHTAIGVLCFGFIALAVTQLLHKNNKIAELCFFYLAAAMGYSRMYLGQHNLLDVSIGGLIALTFLHTSIWIFNNWQGKVAKTQ